MVADAVLALAMESGGSSDHLVEAIATWMHDHPDATPVVVDGLASMLLYTWHSDFGPSWMGTDLWVRAFRSVGFASDTGRSAPTRSLVVFRGATSRDHLGMAWSTSRVVAQGHAEAMQRVGDGRWRRVSRARRVWRAVIPPDGVLARVDQRTEREVVVDPACLRTVTQLTAPASLVTPL